MKILAINGSPRSQGNTARLMSLVVNSAEEHGIDLNVHDFVLNELDFKGCQSCLQCKTEEAAGCVLEDELTPVLELMLESDAWVIGTPVYMAQGTGQLKLLMDRMYGFSGPRRSQRIPADKKAVIVITQGAPVEHHKDFEEFMTRLFTRRGVKVQTIRAGNRGSSGDVQGFSPEIQDEARNLGKWLVTA